MIEQRVYSEFEREIDNLKEEIADMHLFLGNKYLLTEFYKWKERFHRYDDKNEEKKKS